MAPVTEYELKRRAGALAKVRALVERNACCLAEQGRCWRIVGPGVDIVTVDLSTITEMDFPAAKARRVRG